PVTVSRRNNLATRENMADDKGRVAVNLEALVPRLLADLHVGSELELGLEPRMRNAAEQVRVDQHASATRNGDLLQPVQDLVVSHIVEAAVAAFLHHDRPTLA